MIIYKKNKKSFKLIILMVVLFVIIIPKNEKYYRSLRFNFYDKLSSYDTGFSSFPRLVGNNIEEVDGMSFFLNLENQLKLFKKLPNIIHNLLFGINDRPKIARVDLNIKFKDYQKILEDRFKSIEYYVRSDFREVNSELLFNDERFKAKVRLKGDLSQHWRSIHRMSFRVKIKGDNSLLGFKEFSIHKPIA